jgi:hypothetical protein
MLRGVELGSWAYCGAKFDCGGRGAKSELQFQLLIGNSVCEWVRLIELGYIGSLELQTFEETSLDIEPLVDCSSPVVLS